MRHTDRDRIGTRRHASQIPATILFLLLLGGFVLPATAQDNEDADPPRKDFNIRMGNPQNMRMGRNAAGDVIMEMHAPPQKSENQPQVGPFFIYPQVGMPNQGGQPNGRMGSGNTDMSQGVPGMGSQEGMTGKRTDAGFGQHGTTTGSMGRTNGRTGQSGTTQGTGFSPSGQPQSLPTGSGS